MVMNNFGVFFNDPDIRERYDEIERFEDRTGGWAYHNWSHILNVIKLTETILQQLDSSEAYIDAAKIAALFHDTGAITGKDGHALRGKIFAEEYLSKVDIEVPYKKEILSSIENHSDGFDCTEIMTLALIISDKLDITKDRITKAGYKIEGIRQLQFIQNIQLTFTTEQLLIDFTADDNLNFNELNSFYFIEKVFSAIDTFSKKIDRQATVFLNNKEWTLSPKF